MSRNQANKPNSVSREYKVISTSAPPKFESFTPEWALYRFLEAWDPQVMEIAIRKNMEWDLSAHIDTIINYATDEILRWFEKYRPDLHEVLKTGAGRAWLKNNIKQSMTPKYQVMTTQK